MQRVIKIGKWVDASDVIAEVRPVYSFVLDFSKTMEGITKQYILCVLFIVIPTKNEYPPIECSNPTPEKRIPWFSMRDWVSRDIPDSSDGILWDLTAVTL